LSIGRRARFFVGDTDVTDIVFLKALKFPNVPPSKNATLRLFVKNKSELSYVALHHGRYGQTPAELCDELFVSVND
jgi:hypothetical protein